LIRKALETRRFRPFGDNLDQDPNVGDMIVTTTMRTVPRACPKASCGTTPYAGEMAAEAAIAEEVLVLHNDGWTIRGIAKQLGLSRMAAHRIIVAARPAEQAAPGEISATVTRLRRLVDRLDRANRGARLNSTEAKEVAAVLRREIGGMIGA
jgi:hypothetical protein